MMLTIMLYCLLVGCLLGSAALIAERVALRSGGALRGIWIIALAASVILPAASILSGRGATESRPVTILPETAPVEAARAGPTTAEGRDIRLALPDWSRSSLLIEWLTAARLEQRALDRALIVFWAASSTAALLVYGIAWVGLHRGRRRWRRVRLDGGEVLISDSLGPAMFGLAKPSIVVPRWLLDASAEVRDLVLRHEREHVAGRDHLLLGIALGLAALAPWNLALWWQLRRLRLAIEIDCDARVVRGGADALGYSEVLLAVRQRRVSTPLAAVALTEPVSQLEHRIRLLVDSPRRLRRSALAGGTLLATVLAATACVVNPPATILPGEPPAVERQPLTGMPHAGDRVAILVDVSATMLDRSRAGVDSRQRLPASEQRQAPKWRQLIEIVEALEADIPADSRFQIVAFNDRARSLVAGSDGRWLGPTDRARLAETVRALTDDLAAQGPSDLHAAMTAVAALRPPPDNIYIVTDGLPTAGPESSAAEGDDPDLRRFDAVIDAVPAGARVNTILLPKDDDALSAPSYWTLALRTEGSLVAPAEDASAAENLGVPLDSEYLVFIVDTSGSMYRFAWDRVREQIHEALDAYPTVRGIQIVNDEGEPMFPDSRGQWLADTPLRREAIDDVFPRWRPFSNSTPREGIVAAIDSLPEADGNVAIFVYGDDFASGSMDEMLTEVTRHNRFDGNERKARIHSVILPVYYEVTGSLMTAAAYAAVMRELSQQNGGTLIALAAANP